MIWIDWTLYASFFLAGFLVCLAVTRNKQLTTPVSPPPTADIHLLPPATINLLPPAAVEETTEPADDYRIEEFTKLSQEALEKVWAMMDEEGIDRLLVDYSGDGDEGFLGTFHPCLRPDPLSNSNPEEVAPARLASGTLTNLLDDLLCSEFLPGGWQDSDGSCGEITVDARRRRITVEHSWRVTAVEDAEVIVYANPNDPEEGDEEA